MVPRVLWLAAAALLAAGAALAAAPEGFVQPRDADGRFANLDPVPMRGFGAFLRWKWDGLMGRTTRAPATAPVPRAEPDWASIRVPPGPGEGVRLTWVGHATWLVQLDGKSFLTDPVLSDSLAGFIHRNVPPGIPWERLPPIDAALVSHNHYDHLDLPTLQRLGAPVIVGLGTERLLRRKRLVATTLGWWQSTQVGGVRITFVPAQHFSQRGLGDRNECLWGGFVIEGSSATVYHAGDTALFSGFRQIGERFRIDAALLPIGAYDPRWFMLPVHMAPEQALQAFEDLRAGTFLAMHWGTFKLGDEPLDEPPRLLEAERVRRGLPAERVRVLPIGGSVVVRRPPVPRPLDSGPDPGALRAGTSDPAAPPAAAPVQPAASTSAATAPPSAVVPAAAPAPEAAPPAGAAPAAHGALDLSGRGD